MSHDNFELERQQRESSQRSTEHLEQAQLSLPLAELAQVQPELAAYRESDDAPTSFLDTPHPPPSWLVQITPFDRRVMSREALIGALQGNAPVDGRTLVWRQGMKNWQPIAELTELGSHVPAALRSSAAGRASAAVAGLCGLSALAALGATVFLLSAAGVFQSPAQRAAASAENAASADDAAQLEAALSASLQAAPLLQAASLEVV